MLHRRRSGRWLGIALAALIAASLRVGDLPRTPQPTPDRVGHARPLEHRRYPEAEAEAEAEPGAEPEAPAAAPGDQPPEGWARLTLRAVREDGSPEPDAVVYFEDCGDYWVLDARPGISEMLVEPGPCTLLGLRRDGLLTTLAEPVEIDLPHDGQLTASVVFPSARTGGIGISFRSTPEGAEVQWVAPGSPAAQAGLEPGDVIVEVDGVQANALDDRAFAALMTGPEDTPVRFTMAYEGDTGLLEDTVEVIRAFLADGA
jgi:hypothetical protein